SLLATPITLLGGPALAVAVVAILSCPLSALGAYLLCRRVTDRLWPSVIGGYVFGFSTYAIGHIGSQVNLETVFCVPLCVYLVMLRLSRVLGACDLVALLTRRFI